jgi:3-oxoacyl-[acyl-carrier protein] reductase
MERRHLALVTGASRRLGIGAAITIQLARDGWDVATTFWRAYDATMPHGRDPADGGRLHDQLMAYGARTTAVEADLSLVETPARVFDAVETALGSVTALVLCHCHSVDSDIASTTTSSFDLHFAVNARASWLLVREFGRRFRSTPGRGRIVALTSDHVAGNLPYGASKGALDRIVLAAAREFRGLGITANIINPGPTDTGWMTAHQKEELSKQTPTGRVGLPEDCANLVRFLCSADGGWINGSCCTATAGCMEPSPQDVNC